MKYLNLNRLAKMTLIGFLSLFLTGFIIASLVALFYVVQSPALSEEKLVATTSSKIYDKDDKLIADLGAERRVNAEASEIPVNLVNAIVAIEDHRFFDHRGVDSIRIGGAFLNNLRGSKKQGGSTLTQQLIKLTYFSTTAADQTLKRKVQEAWLATQLESKKTKQEIMTYYVNKVYMSNGNYGMQTAAQAYYGKNLSELNVPQLALLAGMPQAPNQYDPYTHPEAALNRRNLVLREMHDMKFLNDKDYQAAINSPVTDGLQPLKTAASYPAYMDNYLKEVINQVEEETSYNLLTTGMEVYTNIDTEAQRKLWDIYNSNDYVAYPDDDMQVASTIVDVTNGKVIAQLGGRHTQSNVSFGYNQAVETDRDWGSTMKPITDYAPAIQNEVYTSTGDYIVDAPYNYPGSNTPVNNWDNQFMGGMSIQTAIEQSRNVPAVKSLEAVGLDKSAEFLKGLGIEYKDMHYSNAISSNTTTNDRKYGASSEKMAAAYAAFANGGTYYKPMYIHRIVFSDGTSKDFDAKGKRAMSEQTAYMMTDMMKTVLNSGTGTNAAISGVFQAGKTGTSNYSEADQLTKDTSGSYLVAPDELFVGYTPKYSMAVWTGYSNRLTPVLDDGMKVATNVYRAMMLYLNPNGNEDFEMPSGLYRNGSYIAMTGAYSSYQEQYSPLDDDDYTSRRGTQSSQQPRDTVPSSTTTESSTTDNSNNTSSSSANNGNTINIPTPYSPGNNTNRNGQ